MLVTVANVTVETGGGGVLSIRHRNGAEVLLQRCTGGQCGLWGVFPEADGWEVWVGAYVLMGNGPSPPRQSREAAILGGDAEAGFAS